MPVGPGAQSLSFIGVLLSHFYIWTASQGSPVFLGRIKYKPIQTTKYRNTDETGRKALESINDISKEMGEPLYL